jgi:hypothetical protein
LAVKLTFATTLRLRRDKTRLNKKAGSSEPRTEIKTGASSFSAKDLPDLYKNLRIPSTVLLPFAFSL